MKKKKKNNNVNDLFDNFNNSICGFFFFIFLFLGACSTYTLGFTVLSYAAVETQSVIIVVDAWLIDDVKYDPTRRWRYLSYIFCLRGVAGRDPILDSFKAIFLGDSRIFLVFVQSRIIKIRYYCFFFHTKSLALKMTNYRQFPRFGLCGLWLSSHERSQ